jgi:hypothetical protein
MQLPKASVKMIVAKTDGRIFITVTSTATAMFVVLTTAASGRFSDNAFLLEQGKTRQIFFHPWTEEDQFGLLKSSLRVEHLGENL